MTTSRTSPILPTAALSDVADSPARVIAGLELMLTIDELAGYLALPVRTLYDWRLSGRGPRAVHVGRQLRYLVSDVQAWLAEQRETAPGEMGHADGRR